MRVARCNRVSLGLFAIRVDIGQNRRASLCSTHPRLTKTRPRLTTIQKQSPKQFDQRNLKKGQGGRKKGFSEALRLEIRRGEAMSEDDYSDQRVRLSIVHAGEDMVTVVVNLSEILEVLKSIRTAI